jgi:hypothetical protein
MTTSWTGYCHGCARTGVPVQTRYDHGAKTLCDACATATRRVPMTPTVASPRPPRKIANSTFLRLRHRQRLRRTPALLVPLS